MGKYLDRQGGYVQVPQDHQPFKHEEKTRDLLAQFGLKLDVNRKVADLSVSEVQMIEIIRAVSYNADIIIMDEPTSAIEEKEVEILFKMIKRLKEEGVSIIYISHKLEEIFKIADTVSILRDAALVRTANVNELSKE